MKRVISSYHPLLSDKTSPFCQCDKMLDSIEHSLWMSEMTISHNNFSNEDMLKIEDMTKNILEALKTCAYHYSLQIDGR